ncbi:MAG TPA: hypothetical protein DDW50_07635 [Firmicutes bacterium]|nr:hypothetical protein [Bacillota bacterium]
MGTRKGNQKSKGYKKADPFYFLAHITDKAHIPKMLGMWALWVKKQKAFFYLDKNQFECRFQV